MTLNTYCTYLHWKHVHKTRRSARYYHVDSIAALDIQSAPREEMNRLGEVVCHFCTKKAFSYEEVSRTEVVVSLQLQKNRWMIVFWILFSETHVVSFWILFFENRHLCSFAVLHVSSKILYLRPEDAQVRLLKAYRKYTLEPAAEIMFLNTFHFSLRSALIH